MEILDSIYNAIGFNAFLEYDFRSFILKTILFSAMLAFPMTALFMLCRSLYFRLYHIFRNDRRNKKGGEYHE